MRVVAGLAAAGLAVAVLAAGCGGGAPSRRDEVTRYIDAVNTIQGRLGRQAQAVLDADQALAQPKGDHAAAERKLRTAAGRIDALRVRLAHVAAPAEAAKLRSLLLDLLRREAGLAREVAAFAAFTPALQRDLQPLAPAGSKLKEALAAKGGVPAKAAALEAYAATIGGVLRRLSSLHPPAVAAPAYAGERRTLARTRAAALALAGALRANRAADLTRLVRRFDTAAAGNQTLAAQRARIAAVVAYNRRVRALASLRARIYRERAHLQASL